MIHFWQNQIYLSHCEIDNYTDFYYIFSRDALLVLVPVTIIIGLALSIHHSFAITHGLGNIILNLSTSYGDSKTS